MRAVVPPNQSLSSIPTLHFSFPLPLFPPFSYETIMGGTKPSSSPSSSSTTAAVCCMCGDHGLPHELFPCKLCRFRSQHKYCSDLYPKAEAYGACNWCLRENGGKLLSRELLASSASASSSSSSLSTNGGAGVKTLHRGSSSNSHLSKPVKKQRVPERSVSDVSERAAQSETQAELSPGPGRSRQGAFRGKVRRYKLLEEVSS